MSGSQNVVSGPATSTSPGNQIEMQILRPHLRPNVSDILGFEPSNESDKNSGDFNTYSKLRLTALN